MDFFAWNNEVRFTDIVLAVATLGGPIAAIQVQKLVERLRERDNGKDAILATLMATRQDRLSARHIEALNRIELAFYGAPRWGFGVARPTPREADVLAKWVAYFTQLNTPRPQDAPGAAAWDDAVNHRFFDLLEAVSLERGYDISRLRIKGGAYGPSGPLARQLDEDKLRRAGAFILDNIASDMERGRRIAAAASAAEQSPNAGTTPGAPRAGPSAPAI